MTPTVSSSTKSPNGSSVSTTYTPDGLRATVSRGGHVTTYQYNALGLTTSVANALGDTTTYTSDGDGIG